MMITSLQGISWLPFQEERVRNAVMHILNGSEFIKYGVTSWIELTPQTSKVIYAVQAHEYLHYAALMKFGGEKLFNSFAVHIDKIAIFGLCLAVAEICIKIFDKKIKLPRNLIGISSFLIICSLPYTYRMLLGLWQDVYCLMFLLFSYLLISEGKRKVGLIVMVYAFLWQYHWSIILGSLYIFFYLYLKLYKQDKGIGQLFPPGFRSSKSRRIFILSFWISPCISGIQSILLTLNGYQTMNSPLMFRVGIDSPGNIHHGGWLSALQFLGGNRVSLCFQPKSVLEQFAANKLSPEIFTFNCIISILGMSLLAILAIISYSIIAKKLNQERWILVPIGLAFLCFSMFFQQALAAHLQGHSMYFAVIFTIGVMGLAYITPWLNKSHPISHVLFSIMIVAITISNIRVSYLTGFNG